MGNLILNTLTLIWLCFCISKILKSTNKRFLKKEVDMITSGAILGMLGTMAVNELVDVMVGITEIIIGG